MFILSPDCLGNLFVKSLISNQKTWIVLIDKLSAKQKDSPQQSVYYVHPRFCFIRYFKLIIFSCFSCRFTVDSIKRLCEILDIEKKGKKVCFVVSLYCKVISGKAKHSNRSCYANLQLSRTIVNLHSMTCCCAQLCH